MSQLSLGFAILNKLLTAVVLAFIGLCVGISCVYLPPGIPLGVVGAAGALLLWTLPDLQYTPERLVRRSLVYFLFASMCLPYYLAVVIPGMPLFSIKRVVIFSFVGLTLITLSASSSVRFRFWENLRASPMLRLSTLGYFTVILSSAFVSNNPSNTITNLIQVGLIWIAPFVWVVVWGDNKRAIDQLALTIFASLLICSAIGLIEYQQRSAFIWKMMPSYARSYLMSLNPTLSMVENGNFRFGAYRAISTFTTSLSWAQMTAMSMPFAAYFVAHGKSATYRFAGFFGIVAGIGALYCSGSRGGYASAIAAGCVFVPVWAYRKKRANPGDIVAGTSLTLCSMAAVVVALSVVFVPAVRIKVLGGGSAQSSDQARQMEWAAAKPKIFMSPIWGYGFGNAGATVNFKLTADGGATLDDYRINLLVENGILGFMSYYLSIAVAGFLSFAAYVRRPKEETEIGIAILSSLVAYTLYSTALSQPDNIPLVFCIIAVAFFLSRNETRPCGRI